LKKGGHSTKLYKTLAQYSLLLLYQITFGLYVRLRYRLKGFVHSPLPTKGPFFLLGNHTNNFDGLFVQCLFPRPIRFVVTDGVFKNKILSRLLHLVDYIPKRKSVSDVAAIRSIIDVVKRGGIVGIFPEGGRNWDGMTGPVTQATFRLVEMLKLPVVVANIRGGYLSEPRWADCKRHGRVEVHLTTVIEGGSELSLDEIEKRILTALAHNEYDWQRSVHIPYRGKALCRGLDRLMFICPICGALGTVVSSDNDAECQSCKSRFTLDIYGFLHSESGTLPADSLDRINAWQQRKLKLQFDKDPDMKRLMADKGGILLSTQKREDPFKTIDHGKVVLTRDQLMIGRYGFDLPGISGIHVYFKSHLEFKYQNVDYRIGFESPHVSAYKWQCAVELVKKRILGEERTT
jgi:1-acyl-sn-glycerol-3-phosphate acyltransferase